MKFCPHCGAELHQADDDEPDDDDDDDDDDDVLSSIDCPGEAVLDG